MEYVNVKLSHGDIDVIKKALRCFDVEKEMNVSQNEFNHKYSEPFSKKIENIIKNIEEAKNIPLKVSK